VERFTVLNAQAAAMRMTKIAAVPGRRRSGASASAISQRVIFMVAFLPPKKGKFIDWLTAVNVK
jgi:hypothetical protein